MEEKECFVSGQAEKGDEAPVSYHVAPRSENTLQFSAITKPGPGPDPVSVAATPSAEGKKKRGRPRKYGPDGTVALALSPMPISSSVPLTGEFSAWKRGRGRPAESIKKSYKNEFDSPIPGERIAYSVGANFTAHVLTVNAGEDITMKVMSFSQQVTGAVCILSATGTISNVTLLQPTSSGGTLTYEGQFEILSLSGSFMPTENGVTRSRCGGMSVSLAGPDGRVVGGGLAGLMVAAGPVQIVVGSFLPGHQIEQKAKKQKLERISTVTPTHVNTISAEEIKESFGGVKPIMTPAAFQGENMTSFNNVQGPKNSSNSISHLPQKNFNLIQTNTGAAC